MNSEFPLLEQCNPATCLVSKTMKINRLMNSIFRKHLADIDITLSQLSMMFLICKKETLIQHEIGDFLYLEKSTVSRNLKRLLSGNFITKKGGKQIQATNKGKKLVEQAIPKWEMAMNESREKIEKDGEEALQLLLNKLSL